MPDYQVVVTIRANNPDDADAVVSEIENGLQDASDAGELPTGASWGTGPITVECRTARSILGAAPMQSMPPSQEPKYGIRGGQLFNRASKEAIPADEPVFILRARDQFAADTIQFYAELFPLGGEHRVAVAQRWCDFKLFANHHPDRMKYPDTAPNFGAIHEPAR